jgi:hypothetical protein
MSQLFDRHEVISIQVLAQNGGASTDNGIGDW